MKSDRIIRSSKLSLKFSNAGKRAVLSEFIEEYRRAVREFVIRFWQLSKEGKLPSMPGVELYKIESWLTARGLQSAAKQAAGIVNGALAKNKRRLFSAEKLFKEGRITEARKLRKIAEENTVCIPKLSETEPQLDARFFTLEESVQSGFDLWLTLKGFDSRKRGFSIEIPLKKHRHFNRMRGQRMPSIRLSDNDICVCFEQPSVPKQEGKQEGKIIGVDIGQKSTLSTPEGIQHKAVNHGWTLEKACQRLARRKKGSKGFRRAQSLRKNIVNQTVSLLNLKGVGTLRLERIKHLRRGRKSSRELSHWSYRDLFTALEAKTQECGVRIEWVNPAFTSQRCSCCGWVRKHNRKGEQFECGSCGNTANADLNAALNIAACLPALPGTARKERWNLNGFFWNPDSFSFKPAHENIVRVAREQTRNYGVSVGMVP